MYKSIHHIISLLLCLLTVPNLHASGNHKIIDNRISIQEGLSQGRILCIIEDRRGYMWFGTTDGLNRYNGYEFKSYKHDKNNPHSIPGNEINCIAEDQDGRLWVGTNNGVAALDIYCERFTSFAEKDTTKILKGANRILSCCTDKNNNLWCSTDGAGIFKIANGATEREYPAELSEYKSIFSILIDSDNQL